MKFPVRTALSALLAGAITSASAQVDDQREQRLLETRDRIETFWFGVERSDNVKVLVDGNRDGLLITPDDAVRLSDDAVDDRVDSAVVVRGVGPSADYTGRPIVENGTGQTVEQHVKDRIAYLKRLGELSQEKFDREGGKPFPDMHVFHGWIECLTKDLPWREPKYASGEFPYSVDVHCGGHAVISSLEQYVDLPLTPRFPDFADSRKRFTITPGEGLQPVDEDLASVVRRVSHVINELPESWRNRVADPDYIACAVAHVESNPDATAETLDGACPSSGNNIDIQGKLVSGAFDGYFGSLETRYGRLQSLAGSLNGIELSEDDTSLMGVVSSLVETIQAQTASSDNGSVPFLVGSTEHLGEALDYLIGVHTDYEGKLEGQRAAYRDVLEDYLALRDRADALGTEEATALRSQLDVTFGIARRTLVDEGKLYGVDLRGTLITYEGRIAGLEASAVAAAETGPSHQPPEDTEREYVAPPAQIPTRGTEGPGTLSQYLTDPTAPFDSLGQFDMVRARFCIGDAIVDERVSAGTVRSMVSSGSVSVERRCLVD